MFTRSLMACGSQIKQHPLIEYYELYGWDHENNQYVGKWFETNITDEQYRELMKSFTNPTVISDEETREIFKKLDKAPGLDDDDWRTHPDVMSFAIKMADLGSQLVFLKKSGSLYSTSCGVLG